jgi:hypothetical protein
MRIEDIPIGVGFYVLPSLRTPTAPYATPNLGSLSGGQKLLPLPPSLRHIRP